MGCQYIIEQKKEESNQELKIEHLNEMGDLCYKYLVIELMGKYSNIIFMEEFITHSSGHRMVGRGIRPVSD